MVGRFRAQPRLNPDPALTHCDPSSLSLSFPICNSNSSHDCWGDECIPAYKCGVMELENHCFAVSMGLGTNPHWLRPPVSIFLGESSLCIPKKCKSNPATGLRLQHSSNKGTEGWVLQ